MYNMTRIGRIDMKYHPISIIAIAVAWSAAVLGCSPQVRTQFVTQTVRSQPADSGLTIGVLGSSVAAGWVTSYRARHDLQNGYAARLGRLLEPRGYTLVNASIPGNATTDVLARMDEFFRVTGADFVLIGLSLGNERLDEDRDAAVATYRRNLPVIIDRCRSDGRTPVVGLCYPYNRFDATDYAYLKQMNLTIDSWRVPAVNFLGAVDDGNGHFVEGYTFDEGHPDNRGHEEMFLSIVPSMFDALRLGKPAPARPAKPKYTTIEGDRHGPVPLCYVPDDLIHSFAVGFRFRTKDDGALAAVDTGGRTAVVNLDAERGLVYESSRGEAIATQNDPADGRWHDVVVSHRYFQGKTLLFVDGRLVGEAHERIEPRRFILGGSGSDGVEPPREADYRDWLVYRSALNIDEVAYLRDGNLFAASMEVYAPLDRERLAENRVVENRAWSTSVVVAMPTRSGDAVAELNRKIESAREARETEFVAEEKVPIEVDPAILAAYAGDYEIAPGDVVSIVAEDGRLFLVDGRDTVEVYAESTERFFIKTVGDITLTFERGDDGAVSRMVLGANGREIPARRVD
jgi:lysophospholipase L1-like esterase